MKELALALGDPERADLCDAERRDAAGRVATAQATFESQFELLRFEAPRLSRHARGVLARQLRTDDAVQAAYMVGVRSPADSPFTGYLLVLRIDPEPMSKRGDTFVEICERASELAGALLEPAELLWVRNVYTTEAIDPKLLAALQAIPDAALFSLRQGAELVAEKMWP
jgi:hypothetical protein